MRSGAISPDGKYLSYSDTKRIYLKLIATGESLVVPEPEISKEGKVEWETGPWFPDSERFLVSSHPGQSITNALTTPTGIVVSIGLVGGGMLLAFFLVTVSGHLH